MVVAVDAGSGGGGESSGGVAFADDLALVFREAGADTVPRIPRRLPQLAGVPHAPAGRRRPRATTATAYDYGTLRRVLLDPFRMGGSTGFQTSAFDAARDQPVESRWLTAGQDAVLVLDGEFPLRPSLRTRVERRPSCSTNAPQAPAYVEDAHPAEFATYLVDDSEPSHPRWAPREG